MEGEILLEVKDLKTYVYDDERRGFFRIVDGVSFKIPEGKTVALIGESGSGKTRTAYSILGLVPDHPGIVGGQILFKRGSERIDFLEKLEKICSIKEDGNLLRIVKDGPKWRKKYGYEDLMRGIRGKHISLVMQEAKSALNPYQSVGRQVREAYVIGHDGSEADAGETVHLLLEELGIAESARKYPHSLSGGMAHRAIMAVAFASDPDLLIADEPTTGMDSPLQIKVIELLERFMSGQLISGGKTTRRSLLLATHQLEIVEKLADRIVVMYAGKVLERGPADVILQGGAKHPYTEKIVRIYREAPGTDLGALVSIPGSVPSLLSRFRGCRFHPRCGRKIGVCEEAKPQQILIDRETDHEVTCHLF